MILKKIRNKVFFFREGIAFVRRDQKKKVDTKKWNLIAPIFEKMVRGNTILDLGAHSGFYCIKALEYGSKEVIAFNIGNNNISNIIKLKEFYSLNDLVGLKGDFYNETDYNKLQQGKYDTVFLFGIVHYLLLIGVQKKILYSYDELIKRIYEITNYGLIIEFTLPNKRDLLLPELRKNIENFRMEEFVKAINKYFPNNKYLGKYQYIPDNNIEDLLFCASKQNVF